MSRPKLVSIQANNIDSAAGEILGALEDTTRGNVMYFYGRRGLGASAALKVVAKRLKSSAAGTTDDPRSKLFDKVIHVDCSVWKSRRALQKAIAEELELPQSVMDMFDRHDEDDDFNGVDQGSRGEISEVRREIFTNLAGRRFVVVFHNGSNSYIDLDSFGIPVYPYLPNRVLWTDRGRFRALDYEKFDEWYDKLMRSSDAFIHVIPFGIDESMLWDLVHEEAKEVAEYTDMPECIDHRIVEECILYLWALKAMGGVDWETHASNYWVCDGIIQSGRSAWEIGDALQSYIHLDFNWKFMNRAIPFSATHLHFDVPRQPPICQSSSYYSSNITSIPPEATSFFMEGDDKADKVLPAGMFQHPDNTKLRVLHLSFCTFSFASPPFLCCHNLRFLLLHHCKDDTSNAEEKDQSHSQISESWKACFGKLWVLDLSYTDLYRLLSEEMINVMADLRELNVKGLKQWHITDLCGSGTSLVKLRVTSCPVPAGNDYTNNQAPFPNLSSANNLKTIILDGCVGLEQVNPAVLLPSLESFSFINDAATAAKISSISFRGCSQLKSILLRGCLGRLEELDLSGTAVKTLDLREVEAPNLKRLILLGCEKLRAILWPPKNKIRPKILEVLRIDTNRSASISGQANWVEKTKEASVATGSSSIAVVAAGATKPGMSRAGSFDFNWYISVRDARLLRSLVDVQERGDSSIQMEIDSSPVSRVAIGGSEVARGTRSLQQPNKYLDIRDVVFGGRLQAGVISWMLDCPPSPTPVAKDWYVHIQDEDEMKSGLLQKRLTGMEGTNTSVDLVPPIWICNCARTLHVHDSLSITTIDSSPQDSRWNNLEWCKVERCTKLHTVFRPTRGGYNVYMKIFERLQTFWASHLPAARYIWNWSAILELVSDSFRRLVLLHLDYCPRIIHVLPLWSKYGIYLLGLETLEIVCCGDLREVFPVDPEYKEHQKTMEFPRLRRIHLHELPALKRICGWRMSTPKLETVEIRGCWGLKRLPAISGDTNPPKVDCEKEWWDSLEWDGVEAYHHPSLYDLEWDHPSLYDLEWDHPSLYDLERDGVEAYHHPSLYEASHPLYYKKAQLPRGTLLR